MGSVRKSSPDRRTKSSGVNWIISVIFFRLPLASFIPTMFFISASFATVSGSIEIPVLDGTLYIIIFMSTASATLLKC